MWHASIAHRGRTAPPLEERAVRALRALHNVGDAALGEWIERGVRALHVRRRLSTIEVERTGLVMRDVRGTPEELRLLEPVRHMLPPGFSE